MDRKISFAEGFDTKLPVFTSPNSLVFYSDDTSSHQQILTLYNPYDFNIKYKVLSTAKEKYKVYDPEGYLKARCSIDLIFKHLAVTIGNENVLDKFRIQISGQSTKKVIGRKDLESILLPATPKPLSLLQTEDEFKSLPFTQPAIHHSSKTMSLTKIHNNGKYFSCWMALALVSAIIFLMLPLENDHSVLPMYLRVTVQQKYIATYVLGLLTMVVIQNV